MKKNSLLFFFIVFFQIGSAQSILDKKIDFEVSNVSISDALLELSRVSNLDISFSKNHFKKGKNISLNIDNQSVKFILNKLLTQTNIDYKVVGDQIILFKKPFCFS